MVLADLDVFSADDHCRMARARQLKSVVLLHIASKELSLGPSLGRPGTVTTNLPGRPAPKTSRKNGSL